MDHQINLNLLRTLNVLLETKSSKASAEILNVSQPAVSKQLTILREHFCDPLLVRNGGNNELSTKAISLQGEVVQTLKRIDSVFDGHSFIPSTQHFNIASNSAIIREVMPPVIKKICTLAPNLSFSFIAASEDLEKRMDAGDVDLYLGTLPVKSYGALKVQELVRVPVQCIMSQQHPLAISTPPEAILTKEMLVEFPHTINRTGFSGTADFAVYFYNLGVEPQQRFSVMEFGAAQAIVSSTNSLLLETTFRSLDQLNANNLTSRKVPAPYPSTLLGACWHNSQAHRWLRQELFDIIKNNFLAGA